MISARSDPSYEERMWCPECGCDAEDCCEPEGHEDDWIWERDNVDWDAIRDAREDR